MTHATSCVLFDLDGTLVDSAPDLGYAANLVRESLGMAHLPLADYRPQASNGARGLLKVALNIAMDHPDYEARKALFLRFYEANLTTHSRLFDGVAEMLAALDAAGVPWGIVTNKAGWLAQPVVEQLGFAASCRTLIAGDSTPHPKPAPDGLLLAARRVGVDPNACVYVGDDVRDVVAGRAAGMRTVAAGWGYLGTEPDLEKWQADDIVAMPAELISLLNLSPATR
ncbi:MAG: phosphoglycolate phosphatase [Xanthomonadaceae bacterium]|nr:phosphoglycolate phosphatase [Xanthomonadaceae bacterium]